MHQEGIDINYSSKSERNSIDSLTIAPTSKQPSDENNDRLKMGMIKLLMRVQNNDGKDIDKLKLIQKSSAQILSMLNDAFDKQMIDFGLQINQIIKQFTKDSGKQSH